MAAPEIGPPPTPAPARTARGLPGPPAETPADFRPVAQRAHDLLTVAAADDSPACAPPTWPSSPPSGPADSDRRLHELGAALAAELAALEADSRTSDHAGGRRSR